MSAEDEMCELWATIPDPGCLGLCQESCGPLGMSPLEYELLDAHVPTTFPGMEEMLQAFMENPEDYHCPLLVAGRCVAYDDRPTICRMFGSEEAMACPYGCKPERALTREEGHAVLQRSMDIGGVP